MSTKLLIFLAIGTFAMGIPIILMSERYEISRWKAILATVILTISGTAGAFLMFFVENQRFGGISFYGAVFVVPVIFLAVTPLLRVPYRKLMDLCAVGECIMLALMKVHCMLGKCCFGRVLLTLTDGTIIRFPSRLAEMAVAIVLFVILFQWGMQGRKRGELYIWYMILYGSVRFLLNIFREAWVTKEMILPFGNVWSLIAITVGMTWLAIIRKRNQKGTVA